MMRKTTSFLLSCFMVLLFAFGAAAQEITVEAGSGAAPSNVGMDTAIISEGKVTPSFTREEVLSIGDAEEYGTQRGVLAFRGGPLRKNAAFGTAKIDEKSMRVLWEVKTGSLEGYTGFDWTGQPLIVKWHKEIRELMPLGEEKKQKVGLKEVIYPSMDGKIYFLDLDDGQETREAITVGYPMKGTAAVDPRGWPILYAGQGISKLKNETGSIGLRVFSLLSDSELYLENGRNKLANITNGAVDGSPIVLAQKDTFVFGGENGLLYTVKLNTNFAFADNFDPLDLTLTLSPKTTAYRYTTNVSGDQGIESSVALYGQYAFFGDNMGVLQCVDLNTMQCVWAQDMQDNTDATVALEQTGTDTLALYTANTLKKRTSTGEVAMRRVNARTGEVLWERVVVCNYDKDDIAGAMASPLIGEGSINDLVIYTLNRAEDSAAVMYALDKQSGEVVWTRSLGTGSWSSPVAAYTSAGDAYILQGGADGMLRMIEGTTGNLLTQVELSGEIVASPAVYSSEDGTILVVGTSDGYIYGVGLY